MNEQHHRNYQYEYIDGRGVGYLGSSLHPSDKEAISYFRSLEENGRIRMRSLKNPEGKAIWSGHSYSRPFVPGLQPKVL